MKMLSSICLKVLYCVTIVYKQPSFIYSHYAINSKNLYWLIICRFVFLQCPVIWLNSVPPELNEISTRSTSRGFLNLLYLNGQANNLILIQTYIIYMYHTLDVCEWYTVWHTLDVCEWYTVWYTLDVYYICFDMIFPV
jgi:hypothetical protein